LAGIRPNLPGVSLWICIGNAGGELPSYEGLFRDASPSMPDVVIEPSDLAWLFYTSGTTGRPKGAMETHRNLITMVEQFLLCVAPDAGPEDVWLHAAPICHGSGTCMFPYLAIGASQAFMPRFEVNAFVEAVAFNGVTSTFLAPTMIARILENPDLRRADLYTLKTIIYGGGPMHQGLLRRALDRLGPIFAQIYGQGEAPFTISAMTSREHILNGNAGLSHRLSSAGRVTLGTQVQIQNDAGLPVARGVDGEICVRGDLVMPGYWRNPEATTETLSGGWLHTGDVGCLDNDDYLYVRDRKKDFIISGGANIYSREIEEVICSHPDVVEAAVVGIPDAEWGESVKAFIVLRPGSPLTAAEIIALCKANLASYKKPKFVEFVGDLPKNATGKVLKRQLRAEAPKR
jgi:acyl-CoA synthetase (AMP-forming)/AMP-acid ligase II